MQFIGENTNSTNKPMKSPRLDRLVNEMKPVERAIIFTLAELHNSSTLDTQQRMRRALCVAETGNYQEATVGVCAKLEKLAKGCECYDTLLDALITDQEVEDRVAEVTVLDGAE